MSGFLFFGDFIDRFVGFVGCVVFGFWEGSVIFSDLCVCFFYRIVRFLVVLVV